MGVSGGANENILVDLTIGGAPVKALVHFDRNGFAYTLDRATGRVLLAEKYGPANGPAPSTRHRGSPARSAVCRPPASAPTAGPPRRGPVGPGPRNLSGSLGAKALQPAAFSRSPIFLRPAQQPLHGNEHVPRRLRPGPAVCRGEITMTAGPGGTAGGFIAWDAAARRLRGK